MSLHLVTGHSGTAHITAADQGALNACLFGGKDYVLKSGENFAASVITNNQIRIADGEVLMQGRHIRLAKGTYEDLTIENGSQGMNRNDLIVIRYTKNADSGIEEAALLVIKGTETTGTATDPEHTTGDILAGDCMLHEMPLYRVPLSGITVGELEPLFEVTAPAIVDALGVNPIASIEEDTPAKWAELGTGYASFTENKLNNQPYPYGVLESTVTGVWVTQKFMSLRGYSEVWYRAGNVNSGWYSGSENWVKSLDENSIQSGSTGSITLAAQSYKDVVVTFPKAFTKIPAVSLQLMSASESSQMGEFNAALLTTPTITGFTIRVFSNAAAQRSPSVHWVAFEN